MKLVEKGMNFPVKPIEATVVARGGEKVFFTIQLNNIDEKVLLPKTKESVKNMFYKINNREDNEFLQRNTINYNGPQ